ncbi:L-serine ammonia-lyase [Nocardia zapadnayensis]|uniref:L-serine ammonia-lyase n=1 Tax=Brevibacterium pityocampae TaxID=506594 RepID=A0ABP8J9T7_9MICO|nr:L-serine ammonia-lyase [Nocardia zapadnayensis]MCX0276967.1 L-serine ammonia-lyase [Nocardia zapadnayensis]
MAISVFDLFTVGIGPSSSHTVGPMRAAASFAELIGERVDEVASLEVDVFGSLAATGRGHGTFDAILLGLEGVQSDLVEPDEIVERTERMRSTGCIRLADAKEIAFGIDDLRQRPLTILERHPNALELRALDAGGEEIAHETYYSVGGGFVVSATEDAALAAGGEAGAGADARGGDSASDPSAMAQPADGTSPAGTSAAGSGEAGSGEAGSGEAGGVPFPFETAAELLEICRREDLRIWEVMLANEKVSRDEDEIRRGLLHIYSVMDQCTMNSLDRSGYLPGGLKVRRRAHDWFLRLKAEDPGKDPKYYQEWVNLIALAVNEENASGGRVVTAPTNGAAGIIPAVLYYALNYVTEVVEGGQAARADAIVRFLLTAGAIGVLYKERASISGAEVGCQGEVGSASSMAAGGLAEVLGCSVQQVENAAEIAMEHNLGLTCDPIAGLVQVPCIERNAIASGKAINAAKMALWGDGEHRVSLDEVIATMRATGADMSDKYKETALGGLAVNVVEC